MASLERLALLLFAFLLLLLLPLPGEAKASPPAMYVFGDSTADVGNNNFLPGSTAKANFPFNGIDFPFSRPTGRFSNGYNGVDFLAKHMGFKRSPLPFLSLSNKTNHQLMRALRGLNFASGGSGILDSTGSTITMTKQIQYFSTIRSDFTSRLAVQQMDLFLSQSIFIVSTGGNDIFAYFSRNNFTNNTESQQFISALITKYGDHLKELYALGARKLGIIDVAPIGCCPYPRSLNPTGGCIETLNELAWGFNAALKSLLHELRSTLTGMKYSIGSSYAVVMNIVNNPSALGERSTFLKGSTPGFLHKKLMSIHPGYREIKTACCGAGKFNGESGCTPNATCCSDRRRYLFWDLIHPTHVTSKLAGLAIYNGSAQFASPVNFRQLVEDNS